MCLPSTVDFEKMSPDNLLDTIAEEEFKEVHVENVEEEE